jgi:hypothetical protein
VAGKKKTLCKWKKKDIQKNLPGLAKIVRKPKFVCMNCGRAAASKKDICKAHPLSGDK